MPNVNWILTITAPARPLYIVGLPGSYVQSSQSVSPFRKWNRVQDLLLLKKGEWKKPLLAKTSVFSLYCKSPASYTFGPEHYEVALWNFIPVWFERVREKTKISNWLQNRNRCFLAVWKGLGLGKHALGKIHTCILIFFTGQN